MELEILFMARCVWPTPARCFCRLFVTVAALMKAMFSDLRWKYLLHESTRLMTLLFWRDETYSYLLIQGFMPHSIIYLTVLASVLEPQIEGRMKSAYLSPVLHVNTGRLWMFDATKQIIPIQAKYGWTSFQKSLNRGYTTGFAFAEEKINEINP